jgi:hypothetical protein
MTRIKKVIFTGLVVLMAAAMLFYFWFLHPIAENEIHLIPEDYIGPVYIFMERSDGEPPRYEGWRTRLYEIPPSGVLISQFEPNPGIALQIKYYYVRADGSRKRIPYFILDKVTADSLQVFGGQVGGITVGEPIRPGSGPYFSYLVGRRTNADSLSKEAERVLEAYSQPPSGTGR